MAMLRRSRAMVTRRHIGARLVFWSGALAIGLVSVGFAIAADHAQELFLAATRDGWRRWLPLLITPAGFVLSAWAAARLFPGTQGSGIPQAIAARELPHLPGRGGVLSLRIAFGKVLLTVAGLACGASIGREGPTVQIGASIMMAAGRYGNMVRMRGLILAGSAAGIAAAFNTPIAGIVFAIEEMGRSFQARTNGVVLTTVIISGIASLWLLGSYTYFGVSHATFGTLKDWLLVGACGICGGLMGAAFSRAVIWITRRLRRVRAMPALQRTLIVALVAGLITAVVGILTGGETWGTGYEQARAAIEGEAPEAHFFVAKLLVTLAATVSGIPGGLFAPSLSVGAGLGAMLAGLIGGQVGLAAILGMAGYFAGVTQAPLTAIVIIVEMTGNHGNIVPVMASAMLGYGTARVISPETLYHALSRLFIADALRRYRSEDRGA